MFSPRMAGLTLFVIGGLLLSTTGCQQESQPAYQDVTVEVSGMTCVKGCAPRAEKALASLPWVKNVKVDFERKRATFAAETERFDESAISKVLTEEGFVGKVLK